MCSSSSFMGRHPIVHFVGGEGRVRSLLCNLRNVEPSLVAEISPFNLCEFATARTVPKGATECFSKFSGSKKKKGSKMQAKPLFLTLCRLSPRTEKGIRRLLVDLILSITQFGWHTRVRRMRKIAFQYLAHFFRVRLTRASDRTIHSAKTLRSAYGASSPGNSPNPRCNGVGSISPRSRLRP